MSVIYLRDMVRCCLASRRHNFRFS